MLKIADTVEFNDELYKKNVAENKFVEDDDGHGKGDDDAADN